MTGLSTTSTIEELQGRSFGVRTARDSERAFRRARRHSRKVRVLRVAIPLIVILILTATVLIRWLDPMRLLARLPASAEGLVISGTKITMASPKLSGFTNDGRRYELTALSATQDITKPDLVELATVDAKIQTGKLTTVHVTAEAGLYDRTKGLLTLWRNVKFKSNDGSELLLEEALINTGTGELRSDKSVEVLTQQGKVRADRFEVDNSGEVVRFIGGVVMTLPGGGGEQKPAAAVGRP